MEYSNVYTAPPTIPARAWALQSASELWKAPEGASGWNLSSDEVQRFSLPSHAGTSDSESGTGAARILLVEDNSADAGLVREALEEHGVEGELLVVIDGEKATEFILDVNSQREARPDLVILDLNLPKRSGYEVLEFLRNSVTWRQVPVVVLTSSDAKKDRDQAIRLGASRYIRKPFQLEEFISLGAIFKAMLSRPAQ